MPNGPILSLISPSERGRPRVHSYRQILNAIFYLLKTDCQWRMLPREFPPFKTVFHYSISRSGPP